MFANLPATPVTAGGTSAPAAGTQETWTVASSSSFPSASTGVTQFHVADVAANSEIIAVTNVSGTTWTVTRGAEGTAPLVHIAGFTVFQVTTAGFLNSYPNAAVNLLVPGYQYPTVGNLWPQINNSVPQVKYVIANPASGPGSSPDANYTAAITAAVAAGITVLGYVDTNFGAVSTSTVQTNVGLWNSLYGVTNIFFDRTATSSGSLPYYTTVTGYVTGKKVLNPGAMPAVAGYMSIADIVIVYEDIYANWHNLATAIAGAPWFSAFPPSKYAAVVYNVPSWNAAATLMANAKSYGVGNVYFTDQNTANPYNVLPAWWLAEVAEALGSTGNYAALDSGGNTVLPSAVFPLNQNWSFESSASPWTGGNGASVAQSSTWAWNGTHSLKITPNGGTANPQALSEAVIGVAGSTAYTATCMVNIPGGFSGSAYMFINWFTSASSFISASSGTSVPTSAASNAGPFGLTETATSPSNAAYAQIVVQLTGTPAPTVLWYIDDVSLYLGSVTTLGQVLRSDGTNAFLSPIAATDLPATVSTQVTFNAPGAGHVGAITTDDITVVPNSGVSQSASMFLDNQLVAAVNQHGHSNQNSNTTTFTTASVTPSVLNCLALAAVTPDSTVALSSVSAGWTNDISETGGYHGIYAAHKNALTSDTSTAISNTFTVGANDQGVTEILLVAPSPGGSPSIVQSTGATIQLGIPVAFTLGSTPTAGNLLIAFIAYSQFAGSNSVVPPNGWTQVESFTGGQGGLDSIAAFYYVVKAGDGKNWSFGQATYGDYASGALYEVTQGMNVSQTWEFFNNFAGQFGFYDKTNSLQVFTASPGSGSGGMSLSPPNGVSLTPGAGGVTINPGAGGVTINPGAGGVTVNPTAGSINLEAAGSGNVVGLSTTAGDVVLQPTGGAIRLKTLINAQAGQQWVRTSINHAASPYGVSSSADYIIGCDPTAGAITINLPSLGYDAQAYIIKDETGQAGTNNITVQCSGHTIDGAATKVISTNYGVLRVYSIGANYVTW